MRFFPSVESRSKIKPAPRMQAPRKQVQPQSDNSDNSDLEDEDLVEDLEEEEEDEEVDVEDEVSLPELKEEPEMVPQEEVEPPPMEEIQQERNDEVDGAVKEEQPDQFSKLVIIDLGPAGLRKVMESSLISEICRRTYLKSGKDMDKVRLQFRKDMDEEKLSVDDLMDLYCGHLHYSLTVKQPREYYETGNANQKFITAPNCHCEEPARREHDYDAEDMASIMCRHVRQHVIVGATNAAIGCGQALEIDLMIETQQMFEAATTGNFRLEYSDPHIEMLALVGIMEEIEDLEAEMEDDEDMDVDVVGTDSDYGSMSS